MTYADAQSAGRSPAAMGATIGAHIVLGWAILHLAGVTPEITFSPEPIQLGPDIKVDKEPAPVDPPPTVDTDVEVVVLPPDISVDLPKPDTPLIVTEVTDLPELPRLPTSSGSGAGPLFIPPMPPAADPVYTASQLDRRYMARFQPPYPGSAKRAGYEGVVAVAVKIGTDGRVTSASVASSSGHASLDRAAVEQAMKRWRFKPATRDGVAITSEQTIKVRFELKGA